MPKKILFESAVHQFLSAARDLAEAQRGHSSKLYDEWSQFILSMQFAYPKAGTLDVRWKYPAAGISSFSIDQAEFYKRGDNERFVREQKESKLLFSEDNILKKNQEFFRATVVRIAREAGLETTMHGMDEASRRLRSEEDFHDEWASAEDVLKIDVRKMNEACTAPEMRYIRRAVGDLKGKTLLDVGCGLGEASVYFALEGAEVTATDLAQKMLDVANQLAEKNGVHIHVHKSAAESLALPPDRQFDIIYAGNLLHHVDIESTLLSVIPYLKPDGLFVSWDPVAYNPIINIYRKRAMKVRTVDEHPLRMRDIRLFREHFGDVHTRWFWLTTLSIFVIMAVLQGRDPNKERYWKKVVEEADRWKWLYKPLEALDRILMACIPFLRPLCWNVVVVARQPKSKMKTL